MDLDDFRSILDNSGVDIWNFIDAAITVASVDYGGELKDRRDSIIGKLFAEVAPVCRNCDVDCRRSNGFKSKPVVENRRDRESSHEHESKGDSPVTPVFDDADADENTETDARLNDAVDDEQRRILAIKEEIEDPHQTEDSLIDLLQSLADMDITFNALQETDIGRHVNRLRKHPSNDVRVLVKQLVRKWKDLVDEWVKYNNSSGRRSTALIDEDSPQLGIPKSQQNGHNQVLDFGYSPNPHNGSSGFPELEPKAKAVPVRREPPPARPTQNATPLNRQRDAAIDPEERLASARKRLQENYQEANNAKKQRTIQVMDIHEIPKPRNGYFAKNRGGFHGRH